MRLGNQWLACLSMYLQCLAEGGRGNYDVALEVLEQGHTLSMHISSPWTNRYYNQLAWLHAELGNWQAAYEIDLSGLQPAQSMASFKEIEISTQINLALDCIALNRLDEAEKYLSQSQENLGKPEFGVHDWRWQTRLADAWARLNLERGDLMQASRSLNELFEIARHTQARKYLARGLLLQAEVSMRSSQDQRGQADLAAALGLGDEMCYPPIRIEARQKLIRYYRQVGDENKAGRLQAELNELVRQVDQNLKNLELRRSFHLGLGSVLGKPAG
jgi:tetratricopeptide (TPR) repeat protein